MRAPRRSGDALERRQQDAEPGPASPRRDAGALLRRGVRGLAALSCALGGLSSSPLAAAEGSPAAQRSVAPSASLSCRPHAGPGRVICELELATRAGRLVWADVLVVQAPPFARPLKSRVGLGEASLRTEQRVRLPVALLASEPGEAQLVIQARAVVCLGAATENCHPARTEVRAPLVVGPAPPS